MNHIIEAKREHLQALCTIDQEVIGDSSREGEIQQAIDEKRCLLYQSVDTIAGFCYLAMTFWP